MSGQIFLSWGANSYGQLGQAHTDDVLAPERFRLHDANGSLSSVAEIGGGGGHSFVILVDGSLAMCGLNDRGQLGLGQSEKRQRQRSRCESSRRRSTPSESGASAGDAATPRTEESGERETPDEYVAAVESDSTTLKSLANFLSLSTTNFRQKIVSVACGWDHTLAVSVDGKLFAFGSNAFGQLGVASSISLADRPIDVTPQCQRHSGTSSSIEKVVSVAAGLRHSLVVTSPGCVMMCGAGRRGQLGRGADEAERRPAKAFGFRCVRDVVDAALAAEDSSATVSAEARLFAGSFHSGLLLPASGVRRRALVVLWGCNRFGQLGLDPGRTALAEEPTILSGCPFGDVEEVSSGWTHLLLRTSKGEIYSWGRNCYGQLGRNSTGDFDPRPTRVQLPGDENSGGDFATRVQCGSEHSMVLTARGSLFSFGWNEHGMCGAGDEENRIAPCRVNWFNVEDKAGEGDERKPIKPSLIRWVKIGAGFGHSFAVAEVLT